MTPLPTELERTQDRLRSAEVVIMQLYHRIDALEAIIKAQLLPFQTFEHRELKYDTDGLRLVVKDVTKWD